MISEERRARVRKLYISGKTVLEISAMCGIHRSTISHILSEGGIEIRSAKYYAQLRTRTEQTIAIEEELIAGVGQSELARKYGVTRQWVHAVVERLRDEGRMRG